MAELSLFWEDLHNLCKISVYKLALFDPCTVDRIPFEPPFAQTVIEIIVVFALSECSHSCEMSIHAGWGKISGRTRTLAKFSLFWEDLHNLCKILVYKLVYKLVKFLKKLRI